VVVYTGAIMVLVVFVIMLLNLGDERRSADTFDFKKTLGVALVVGFLLEMIYVFASGGEGPLLAPNAETLGEIGTMGHAMFSKFLLPFEMSGMILLIAIIGAVVLAKRKPKGSEKR
jgi:NADH-quinone oxidoreductase subunit J